LSVTDAALGLNDSPLALRDMSLRGKSTRLVSTGAPLNINDPSLAFKAPLLGGKAAAFGFKGILLPQGRTWLSLGEGRLPQTDGSRLARDARVASLEEVNFCPEPRDVDRKAFAAGHRFDHAFGHGDRVRVPTVGAELEDLEAP